MTRFSLFFGTFLALFLAGCASVPPSPASLGPLPIAQRQEVLAAVSHWVAQGQASVRSQQGAQSFAFRWQQGPKEQHLRISGPLGTTLAELKTGNYTISATKALGVWNYPPSWKLVDPKGCSYGSP